MVSSIWGASRDAARVALRPFPNRIRLSVEEWLHRRHELRKLVSADAIIVSFPKSGRTWVRALLSYYFKLHYGFETAELLRFDNYARIDSRIPHIAFTHDTRLRTSFSADDCDDQAFEQVPVILITRDPRDTVVSAWHHVQYRTPPDKREILGLAGNASAGLDTFVRNVDHGLPRICSFYARWAHLLSALPRARVVRYENLREDTVAGFETIVRHLGLVPRPAVLAAAAREASFQRMQLRERRGEYDSEGRRFGTTANSGNPEAYKVRSGRVGGYAEYCGEETLAWMESYIDETFPAGFGYRSEEKTSDAVNEPSTIFST